MPSNLKTAVATLNEWPKNDQTYCTVIPISFIAIFATCAMCSPLNRFVLPFCVAHAGAVSAGNRDALNSTIRASEESAGIAGIPKQCFRGRVEVMAGQCRKTSLRPPFCRNFHTFKDKNLTQNKHTGYKAVNVPTSFIDQRNLLPNAAH